MPIGLTRFLQTAQPMSLAIRSLGSVTFAEALPDRCRLCGTSAGAREADELVCADCGWRHGDVPDYDLAPVRVDVVYYLRAGDRLKIGTSSKPRQRLAALRFDELLAFEPGDRTLEQARHREFAALRGTGEWFEFRDELAEHVERLSAAGPPWVRYARWVSEANA